MTVRGRGFRPTVWLCAAVMSLALASTARAATLTVTATGDPDNGLGDCATTDVSCSLREAVNTANAAVGGGDVISLPASATSYTLSLGTLTFTASATIDGAGASGTVISGGDASRIMTVDAPAAVTVGGVTLEDGNGSGDRGGAAEVDAGAALEFSSSVLSGNSAVNGGGAIEDNGTLAVEESSLTDNITPSGGGGAIEVDGGGTNVVSATVTDSDISGNTAATSGGAITEQSFNTAPGSTSVTVTASTLSGNTADTGGGAIMDSEGNDPANLTVSDSTLDGNTATVQGGAAYIGNGPNAEPFTNDTIAANSVTGASGGGDIALGGGAGAPVFENTIVAAGKTSNGSNDCDGTVDSAGHNLADDDTCGFVSAPSGTDLVSTNPDLGPLQSNGGPLPTMALLTGSPAINAGSNTNCPAEDERGVARPQGAACDIGAYESAPPVLGAVSFGSVATTTAAFTASVADPDVQSGGVFFQIGTSTDYDTTTSAQALTALSPASPYQLVLGGLTPGILYHFRVVAFDPDGIVYGPDQQFTTSGSAPTTTTTTTTTTPSPTPPANGFTFGRVKVASGGGLTVALGTPDGGHFSAKATFSVRRTVITHRGKKRIVRHVKTTYTYGTGSASSAAKGTSQLRIGLSGSAARELKKVGSAKITITVTFTPTGGTSHKESTTVTVKRNRKGKYS
jgi:CSLREA domain-containing protein